MDCAPWPQKFGQRPAYLVEAKYYSMLADTQAPKTGNFPGQRSNIALLPGVCLVKGAAKVPPNTGILRIFEKQYRDQNPNDRHPLSLEATSRKGYPGVRIHEPCPLI
jgi:hypothetical protein